MKNFDFYPTTIINLPTKIEYVDNIVFNHKFTPLVSIANSISYQNITMPNWKHINVDNYPTWDMYRHSMEWLVYVLEVWDINNNNQYVEFVSTIVNDWIDQFRIPGPYHSRMIWYDHAVSCRMYVLINILNRKVFADKIQYNLKEIINEHKIFLENWLLENENKTHNHVLIAAISLINYCLYFEQDEGCLNRCLKVVERYTNKNFIDGINIENSPGYQFHVLVYLIRFCYSLAKINKHNILNSTIYSCIEQSYPYLSIFKRDNDTIPIIGDTNLNLDILANYQEEYNNLDNMVNFLISKNILKNMTIDKTKYQLLIKIKTGYVFMLKDNIQLIVRTDPIEKNYHTHNDQMSVNYYRNGFDWISDVGSYLDAQKFCFSRMAHNVVLQNMENINTDKDIYTFDKLNNYHILITMTTNNFNHQREIVWKNDNKFIIVDTIKNYTNKPTVFNQIFHLDHRIKVDTNNSVYTLYNDTNKDTLKITQKNTTNFHIYEGSKNPFCGWICHNASELKTTNTLCYSSEPTNETQFYTEFDFLQEKVEA